MWLDLPRVDVAEQIDDAALPYHDVRHSMADLARTNQLFGGVETVHWYLSRMLRSYPKDQTVRILDIATGSGDIPRRLIDWGEQRGIRIEITAVDNQRAMLQMARESLSEHGDASGDRERLQFVQADALSLPFPPRSFDFALCALAFHHFGFEDSARVLAVMDQLTTGGFVVSDLRRDLPTLWTVQAGMHLLGAHPVTRHDGPASVRRAFTPREYAKIVAISGVQNVRVSTRWYFRVALVQDKSKRG